MNDALPSDPAHTPAMESTVSGREGFGAPRLAKPSEGMFGCAVLSLLLGLSYYFPAHPGLDISAHQSISTFAWPAPALGVALLWRRRMREWPVYLLVAALALALVSGNGWQPPPVDLALAGVGLFQAALGGWLGRRWIAPDGHLDSSRRLLLFTLLLPVALASLHTLLMSTVFWWGSGGSTEWIARWPRIYVANAMALLTLVPALLTYGTPAAHVVFRDRSNWLPIGAAFACMALAFVPHMPDEVVRTALTLPLCWAAVRSGMVLVAQLNAAISIGMVAITLAGFGPYVEFGYGMWTLQVDLIGIAILSMLLAVTIGERQRLAARLDQARRFESLGFLAGGIAHDFNNVLGTIRACAEIAGDRMAVGSPGRAELAQLERAAERGVDMTQQILLAARQGDADRSCVDLDKVVDEVLEMARPLCPKHIRIVRAAPAPGALAPQVMANRSQLVRAVQNLLRNAIQAARQEVTVQVGRQTSTSLGDARFHVLMGDAQTSDGAMGWVEVVDDGAGIDAAHWPHLFDPFFSTRKTQGGSGLGLAIVAGVASGHRGFVGMSTMPGRGCRFRLGVPIFEGLDGPRDANRVDPPINRREAV